MSQTRPADNYSPLYFLAALGAGGLVVTFFMWLMFWVPHPGKPVPVFEDILAAFTGGNIAMQAMIALAAIGIAVFSAINIKSLIWNIGRFRQFQASEAYAAFSRSNAGSQVLAMPLAMAMTVNVGFILGLVFVPGLWSVVEYLFPLALIAFLAIAVLAFRQLGSFFGHALTSGEFKCSANASFAQALPAFALAMIGVGLSAPASMSTVPVVVGISFILSSFFLVFAVVLGLVAMILGIRAMLEHGVAAEAAPTLMIGIPMLTVLGILMLRQSHGLHVHFDVHGGAGETLVFLTRMMSLEVIFAMFGLLVLARIGYAKQFLFGTAASAGNYALVCPGVALSVLTQFWINKGLVAAGLIAKFGVAYWALSGVAVAIQFATIALVLYLNRRHFKPAGIDGAPSAA